MLHKPMAPKLQVKIKTHKKQYIVRPVVNNINTPTYRVATFLNKKPPDLIQLPNTYNVLNSAQMANNLIMIKLSEHHRCITLDIKDLFTNRPIIAIINVTKQKFKHNHITENTIIQYVKPLYTILTQNYFTYDNKFYTCNKGVAMGSPIYPAQ